ncbi:MAG: hypothetical protein PHN78_00395 [Dehalococcoidales bacterium]|nr:hypothetical protein [Dehalococcoidales bacterium]
MRNRGILYILLALGIVLIGSGAWLLHGSSQAKVVVIPEGNPVIYEKLDYVMRGQFNYLYFYDDGSIIYIEEKGLRLPSPGHPPTRTWSTGKLTQQQLDSLLAYLENSELDKLDEHYTFPGEPIANGGFRTGDMQFTITVNSENLSKTVTAFGYLTPDNGEKYPDMPSPLNEIYGRLRTLTMTTEKVYQENISR